MNRLVPSLVLLAACTPNNATVVTGSYITFLSDGSSLSLSKNEVPLDKYTNSYAVDCREFDTPADKEALQLPNALKICNKDSWPPVYESWANQTGYYVVEEPLEPWRGEAVITAEGDLQVAFHHHIPGGQDMRFLFSIDPDFAPQTCVQNDQGKTEHVPLDGDWIANWSDETLGWVADQADKPQYGTAYDNLQKYLDGRLYFLNALSYQYNPLSPDSPAWDVPPEWVAGSAQGKFVEENVYQRRTRYGDPQVYNAVELSGSTETNYQGISVQDLFWCDLEKGQNPDPNAGGSCEVDADCTATVTGVTGTGTTQTETSIKQKCYNSRCEAACGGASDPDTLSQLDDKVHQISSDIRDELQLVMQPDKTQDPVFDYAPLVHSNFWREPDGTPAGFDGWSQLEYNYVVFSKDSDLTIGGSAKGAFTLVFDAAESSTRMFVKGEFVIDKIKNDHWKTENLQQEKLIENGSTLCAAASPQDADPSSACKKNSDCDGGKTCDVVSGQCG